ncbi:hypothetical protein GW17_00030992 [Ensete ventricosum]|nr:hypothetical protein GW17_00030992 [Ensete ventricosum]
MTWELAESGRHFITSIINGADLVPSFSAASVDDLRSEVVMTRAKSVAQAAWSRPPLRISSWSCIGPRYRNNASFPITRREENIEESSMITKENGETLATLTETTNVEATEITTQGVGWTSDLDCSQSSAISHSDGPVNTGDISDDEDATGQCRNEDSMTEYDLWQQLENELNKPRQNEEVDIDNEIREEENTAASAHEEAEGTSEGILTETKEVRRFYPPGKIMHIVIFPPDETTNEEDSGIYHDGENSEPEYKTGIFLTPRSLYGKLRLSQSMINDHFMPIYRRNIERLINILEKDTFEDGHGDEAML